MFIDENSEKDYIDYLKDKEITIEEFKHIEFNPKSSYAKLISSLRKTMLRDKAYILSASSALISYLRSYKEHILTSIFNYEALDMRSTALSFFLFQMPITKDLFPASWVGHKYLALASEDELLKLKSIEFRDKNQEKMITDKINKDKEKRGIILEKRPPSKKVKPSKADPKKIRSKAERNRAKMRDMEKEMQEYSKEIKLEKKLKKGKISGEEYNKIVDGKYKAIEKKVVKS